MTVKLWKENKTDQEWEIPVEELVKRFMESKIYKDKETLYYHGVGPSLTLFISGKDGLNSVIENEDFKKVEDCLFQKRQDKAFKNKKEGK